MYFIPRCQSSGDENLIPSIFNGNFQPSSAILADSTLDENDYGIEDEIEIASEDESIEKINAASDISSAYEYPFAYPASPNLSTQSQHLNIDMAEDNLEIINVSSDSNTPPIPTNSPNNGIVEEKYNTWDFESSEASENGFNKQPQTPCL